MRKCVAILGILWASAAVAQQRPQAHKRHAGNLAIQGTITRDAVHVERQAPLPPNVRAALAISQGWLNHAPAPTTDDNGRVLYLYGKGAPTVVCAEFHLCEIDLQPGEALMPGSLDVGDDRFIVTARKAGSGQDQYTYLVVKPKIAGLDTSLMVGTDEHEYWIRLMSQEKDQPYMARVAFQYPVEEEKNKQAVAEAMAQLFAEEEKARTKKLMALSVEQPIRNWNYSVKLHGRDAKYLRPKRIGDNGAQTYILLSEEARHRGLPVIQLKDARGPIPANSHWEGNELVVDAVFEKACLLEGVGRKQQRACIKNKGLQN